MTEQKRIIVGVAGNRMTSPSAVRADLLAAGATAAEVDNALAQAQAHPADFEPVFTVSSARFAQLKAAPGPTNVYAVRGTEFQQSSGQAAITACTSVVLSAVAAGTA